MSDERNLAKAEWLRRLTFGFTVDSLVFSFHYFVLHGFEPVIDEETRNFCIRDYETGDELNTTQHAAYGKVLDEIKRIAPLAHEALRKRNQTTEVGAMSDGAIGEAYDRFRQEEESR